MNKNYIFPFVVLLAACTSSEHQPSSVKAADAKISSAPEQDSSVSQPVKDLGGSLSEGFTTTQTFKGVDIAAAYARFLKLEESDVKYLEAELPKENKNYKKEEADVSYQWESSAKLTIVLSFPGGETTISFKNKGSDTEVIIVRSPD